MVDHSLLAKDFERGQVPRGARGARGARGRTGSAGKPGAPGAAGTIPAASAANEPAPPTVPSHTEATFNLTTSFAGGLFLEGRVSDFTFGCNITSCTVAPGPYLDGGAVPDTGVIDSAPCSPMELCAGAVPAASVSAIGVG